MNNAETRVWVRIRRSQLGVRFRRQVVIGPYIADFACHLLKLVIEIDGSQHFESEYDAVRDEYLRLHGWTVIRIESSYVVMDPEAAVDVIRRAVTSLRESVR